MDNLQLIPGLIGGMLTCVPFSIMAWLSYIYAIEIWIADVTRGEQEIPAESKGKAVAWALAFTLCLLGGSIATAWWVAAQGYGFWAATLAAYWVQVVINLFDLVVIDILVYQWMKPKLMDIPGVPRLEGTWPHVIGAAKGLIVGVFLALIAGAVSLLA
ncbi:MAG: hypothetical protein AAGJ10_08590 [Bacteroidota bacterium]